MDFFSRLEALARAKDSLLCVGLDPRVASGTREVADAIVEKNRRLIEATSAFVICYKPNSAFYEMHGPAGMEALERSIALVPDGIPVLLDAKRCDIGATAEAYAEAIFGRLKADAVTLSPYMGRDAVDPFLRYEGRGVFLLSRTSNPSARRFQDLAVGAHASAGAFHSAAEGLRVGHASSGGEPLFVHVARECLSWSKDIGIVAAGNDIPALGILRAAAPKAWFLAPGIGAQGGDPESAFAAGARADGLGILIVAARSVADAADPARAACLLRDACNKARDAAMRAFAAKGSGAGAFPGYGHGTAVSPSASVEKPDRIAVVAEQATLSSLKRDFISALIRTECFKLGEFILKSGRKSPFYVDLRRLVSDPNAMRMAGEAYAKVASGIVYDRIAGIPAAALPLATVASMSTGKPMIWPRMPAKAHGTGNRVEGAFVPGERALLLDDLITTGASKLEAVAILKGEGLIVEDLAVLIERGKTGRAEMEASGIRLHAFLRIEDFFATCESLGLIDDSRRRELEAFVDAE